ncbi:MAG: uroporphyrinogen-III C-methyltransferase [Candidatus Hinthialibacter antarcticus]|nr:uroporphyrinogen-III C-methyltransferase [Candidatus Hinthialibacter antarcticus]
MPEQNTGVVYLVGAGPGDPGLLTVKGRDALLRAEVLVYDNLVADEIVALAPPSAERIYVGKTAGRHTMPQESINELLAEQALDGKIVVRLKGGDPFIFGRGSEECIHLRERGARFEVVPGISAAAAVPAYAGIPVTSRNLATSVHIITGHEHAFKENASVDWSSLAKVEGTLVIFMGVYALQSIAIALINHGRNPQTPAAAIRWGTTPEQHTITGTLQTIAAQVEQAGMRPPGLIVIGEVVGLRDSMEWFENRPLFGLAIAAPRSRYAESRLVTGLRDRGARVIELPELLIQTTAEASAHEKPAAPQIDWDALETYDAFLFAGPSAVSHFIRAMLERRLDSRSLAGKQIVAVGAAVEKALLSFGLTPDYVQTTLCLPIQVAQMLRSAPLQGKRVLAPGPPLLPQKLIDSLQEHGVQLDLRLAGESDEENQRASETERKQISLIAFSCASMVKTLVDEAGKAYVKQLAQMVPAASISDKATQELTALGFDVKVQSRRAKVESLLEAIEEYVLRQDE